MAGFDTKFDLGLKRFGERLEGLAKQASDLALEGTERIAAAAARRAAQLTPRSDEGTEHIADGWTVQRRVEGDTVFFRVVNVSRRGNATIKIKRGGETSLLRIMEFGARPHVIRPKRHRGRRKKTSGVAGRVPGDQTRKRRIKDGPGSDVLVFFWKRFGMTIYARRVSHPKSPARGMLRIARSESNVAMSKLLRAIITVVRLGGRAPNIPVTR